LTVGVAFAAGSITFAKRELKEASGSWSLMMTIMYGGKPSTPHVPFRFSFTPVVHYERYLDDAHKDVPQVRKIPLTGQMPLVESVDVDFADSRGKLYDRTKFDFTVTRSHNFEAGEYSVVVRRADGAQVGPAQTLIFEGDNPVIDRRAISFVGNSGAKKAPVDAGAAPDPAAAQPATSDKAPAAGGDDTSAVSDNAAASDQDGGATDPSAAERVPPGSHGGCGCRTSASESLPFGAGAVGFVAVAAGLLRRGRRRRAT
jgi:hypothetical protein